MRRVGFGGGCHWCTEAIFESLNGVDRVEQGWISGKGSRESFSEAVIVHYSPSFISLETLIRIHIHTHSSESDHAMRDKYKSAVYYFDQDQRDAIENVLSAIRAEGLQDLVTAAVPFGAFRANRAEQLHYYYTNRQRPFCTRYVDPKLEMLLAHFPEAANVDKIGKPS